MVSRKRFFKVRVLNTVLLLLFFSHNSLATGIDSLLISNLKNYFQDATGHSLEERLFTIWSKNNRPYVILYVSSRSKVAPPLDPKSWMIDFGYNEDYAKTAVAKYEALGCHAFLYKTYANSVAELKERFISYTRESLSFIALHELFHNYIRYRNKQIESRVNSLIPYYYEEALGDIVGNYGSIEFAKTSKAIDIKEARKQRTRTERIYSVINKTTERIDADSSKAGELNLRCQKRLAHLLVGEDLFQRDRFDYTVNNAFLLKNRNYAENYFLLKKLLRKCGSVKNLIHLIDSGPTDPASIDQYLKNCLTKLPRS